jgi:uncharacterized cupin superfamily protein
MHPPILNLHQVELEPLPEALAPGGETAGRYQQRMARIGQQLGSQKLGYRLYVLAPGMRGSPFHSHRVNEEMFYVVAGEGEVRLGAERFPIREGDVIACPPGGPEKAHQIINTSQQELRYLAVSTQQQPEICEYPDSNKYAVMDNFSVDAAGNASGFVAVARQAKAYRGFVVVIRGGPGVLPVRRSAPPALRCARLTRRCLRRAPADSAAPP